MSEERRSSSRRRERTRVDPAPVQDEFDVPKWAHPKVTAYDLEPEERKRLRKVTERRTTQRATPARDGFLLGMAIAPGATSILALFVSVVPVLSGTGDIPLGIVLVLIMQVAALATLSQMGTHPWGPSWISVGFLTSVMMPMLALQVSLLHEPWVSLEMDSAGPVILATILVLGLYASFCFWVLWVGQHNPAIAPILLMPSTLAIPALIGEPGLVDQHGALMILSEVTLITAIAAAIVWLFPGWPQLLAGAGALAVELARLWAAGKGPWRHETSGSIVSAIYIVMLIAAVLAIVLIPMLCAMAKAPGTRRTISRATGR